MGKTMRYVLVVAALLLGHFSLYAQIDRREVRQGNRQFRKENFREADVDYRKALVKDSTSFAANYNLASTLYRLGSDDPQGTSYQQAKECLDRLSETAPASEYEADYHYNRGDVAIAMKDWKTAVEAFRQSLLLNPGDLDAKENYIYARKMLENQQNQQNQNNDQNQDNKDQNQDNKDNNQDQNQDQNQDNSQDQNKDQNKDNQDRNNDRNQNQNQPDREPKISPQAAQQMLKAIQAKEAQTQEKVKKEKAEALQSRQKEKNW